jgi:hypothetical protein
MSSLSGDRSKCDDRSMQSSWWRLGAHLGILGAHLGRLGAQLMRLGAHWGRLGAHLERRVAQLGRLGANMLLKHLLLWCLGEGYAWR